MIIVYMLWNLGEKQIEVLKSIQSISFCCFDQAVQDSTGFRTIGRFYQNKIFSAKSKWTDCPLCSCEISINFPRENKLTLFLAIRHRQIIKRIVNMQYFGDPVISLLGDGTFGCSETDRFYKVCKKSLGMMDNSERTVPVYLYVSLFAIFDFSVINLHNLYRSFDGVDDLAVIDQFMYTIIDKGEIHIRAFNHPVCHGISGRIDAVHLEEQQGQVYFS